MSAFTVEFDNRAGQLARLCEAMAVRGVNIVVCGAAHGDTGTVVEVPRDGGGLFMQLDGGDGERVAYTRGEAREQLRLAYASTVHKSQGSEYPWVVVVCHSTHKRMLTRRLLYTAITRAKEGVVLIGDRVGVEWAVSNTREVQRCTWLQHRVRGGAAAARDAAGGGENA